MAADSKMSEEEQYEQYYEDTANFKLGKFNRYAFL